MRRLAVTVATLVAFFGLAAVAQADTATFSASEDGWVTSGSRSQNRGTDDELWSMSGSPTERGYLKFDVAGVTGPVTGARLIVKASGKSYSGSSNGPAVQGTTSGWTESGLTYSNAPGATTGTLANAGSVGNTSTVTYTLPVSQFTAGNGTYSFRLNGESSNDTGFFSREGATPPRLELDYTTDTTPPAPSGYVCTNPRWEANFNTALPPNVQAVPGRVTRGTTPAPFEGTHYGRFEVQDGDNVAGGERADARTSGNFFANGEEAWIRDRIRIPADTATQSGWRIVGQVHTSSGSPAIATFLRGTGSNVSFRVGHGNGSRVDWDSPGIARDQWYDVVIHWLSSSNGFVEVWFAAAGQPPVLQQLTAGGGTLVNGGTRKVNGATRVTDSTEENYWKEGLYRDSTVAQTDVVHHDGSCIASTQSQVGL